MSSSLVGLLSAKRGIFWIIYLFIKGIARGEPIPIIIAVVILLVIVGWTMYKYLAPK